MKKMKVLFADGKASGHFGFLPIPEPGDHEVRIRICYCGVCGTDQDLFSGDCSFAENGQVSYPVRLGHEWSGVVDKIGGAVTAVKSGDRVVGDNCVACGVCEDCRRGDYSRCRHARNVGTIDPVYDGAFAEYFVLPERHVHRIPDWLSLKEAALCEPFSVAYGGIKRMEIKPSSTVAVIGTGCIALAAAALAKSKGAAQVFVIGRNPEKLKAAKRLGAETVNIRETDAVSFVIEKTSGEGADFVLECSGASGTFAQAMALAANKATVALIGFYEEAEKAVNIDVLVSKALTVFGVMGEFGNMRGVLDLLDQTRPDLLPIITAEMDFDNCLPAFLRKNTPNAVKTMITICGEENK